MAVVIGGVWCEELVAGYSEEAGRGGLGSTKEYLCYWSQRYQLANSMLGLTGGATSRGGPFIFTPGLVHPESDNMRAMHVSIRGAGEPSQGPRQLQFPYAVLQVAFGVPSWEQMRIDDPYNVHGIDPSTPLLYASQRISAGIEMYSVPGRALRFQTSGNKLKEPYSFRVVTGSLDITFHSVPFLPTVNILPLLGKINNSYFLGVNAGYLMFDNVDTQRTASTDGTRTQELSYSFKFRDIAPWSYSFDTEAGVWDRVDYRTGPLMSTPLIQSADLWQLIPDQYRG